MAITNFHMDQQGPTPSRGSGHVWTAVSPLREERATGRRTRGGPSFLEVIRTDVPKALAGAGGTERYSSPLAEGPLLCCWCRSPLAGGPLRCVAAWSSRTWWCCDVKTQLDELEPRAGCEPETGRPTWMLNLVGMKGRAGPKWIAVRLFGARGRWHLGHPDPLDSEGGVGVPEIRYEVSLHRVPPVLRPGISRPAGGGSARTSGDCRDGAW